MWPASSDFDGGRKRLVARRPTGMLVVEAEGGRMHSSIGRLLRPSESVFLILAPMSWIKTGQRWQVEASAGAKGECLVPEFGW